MSVSMMVSQLVGGMFVSIQIFVVTLIFSLPLGMIVAFGRMSNNPLLKGIVKVYISVMRGTPLMLQLMVVYFGPYYLFGIKITNSYRLWAALIGFVINYAAYFAEIFRGGFQSVDQGQFEAARVLRLSYWQTLRKIIIPQVIKIVIPSIGNEVINLVKDSSLVYVIGLGDLLRAGNVATSRDVTLVPLMLVGLIYLILVGICTLILRQVEKCYAYFK